MTEIVIKSRADMNKFTIIPGTDNIYKDDSGNIYEYVNTYNPISSKMITDTSAVKKYKIESGIKEGKQNNNPLLIELNKEEIPVGIYKEGTKTYLIGETKAGEYNNVPGLTKTNSGFQYEIDGSMSPVYPVTDNKTKITKWYMQKLPKDNYVTGTGIKQEGNINANTATEVGSVKPAKKTAYSETIPPLTNPDIESLPDYMQEYYVKLRSKPVTPEKLNLYKSPDSWTDVLTAGLQGALTGAKGALVDKANDEEFFNVMVPRLEQITGKRYANMKPAEFAKELENLNLLTQQRQQLGERLTSDDVKSLLSKYETAQDQGYIQGKEYEMQNPELQNVWSQQTQFNQIPGQIQDIRNRVDTARTGYDSDITAKRAAAEKAIADLKLYSAKQTIQTDELIRKAKALYPQEFELAKARAKSADEAKAMEYAIAAQVLGVDVTKLVGTK